MTDTVKSAPDRPAAFSRKIPRNSGGDAPLPQLYQYGAITRPPITRNPTWAANHGARSASICLT
ncbi:hypothetical protein SAMN05216481_101424 [Streptomyces radiopugnans]|uniref:Uncharacterized protein n=1 Tax=Streptomyces radiopugnans TaxID=403935 RepID=A0A1H8ZAZ7_9ACTN|nr:hypothetical protein SAMN05216481_101424 [Streptomyces radiopugnans]